MLIFALIADLALLFVLTTLSLQSKKVGKKRLFLRCSLCQSPHNQQVAAAFDFRLRLELAFFYPTFSMWNFFDEIPGQAGNDEKSGMAFVIPDFNIVQLCRNVIPDLIGDLFSRTHNDFDEVALIEQRLHGSLYVLCIDFGNRSLVLGVAIDSGTVVSLKDIQPVVVADS